MTDEQEPQSPASPRESSSGSGHPPPRARAQRGPSRRTVSREERRRRSESRRNRRRSLYLVGGGLIAAALIAGLVLPSLGGLTPTPTEPVEEPQAQAVGEETPIQTGGFVAQDAEVAYDSSPPTSGPRLETPAAWGVHEEQVRSEAVVRNLHIGGVVFNHGAADEAALADLRSFVETLPGYPACYVVHPYPGVAESEVTLTAWGWTHTVALTDTDGMEAFAEFRRNQGEAYLGADCGASSNAAEPAS